MGTGDHAKNFLALLQEMWRLRKRFYYMDHNPWELPPAAVVAAGIDSIHGYYNELQESATDPEEIQSLKVVFAGHSGAGKTRYALNSPFSLLFLLRRVLHPLRVPLMNVSLCRPCRTGAKLFSPGLEESNN